MVYCNGKFLYLVKKNGVCCVEYLDASAVPCHPDRSILQVKNGDRHTRFTVSCWGSVISYVIQYKMRWKLIVTELWLQSNVASEFARYIKQFVLQCVKVIKSM